MTEEERFISGVYENENGCWIWPKAKVRGGYGMFKLNKKNVLAHRYSYTKLIGDIPNGLTIDHLCKQRDCVNPDHLEAVTMKENISRGTNFQRNKSHCKWGHEFNSDNIYWIYSRYRRCKQCQDKRDRERKRKKPAEGLFL